MPDNKIKYTTVEQQIEKLKQQNLIIDNEEFARDSLTLFGYSNLIKSYREPYMVINNGKKTYRTGVTFNQLHSLYSFDKNLRNAVMAAMLDLEEHIKEDDLRLTSNVRSEIQDAKELEKEVIRIKSDLKEAIESNDAARIYEYFGVEVEADKSGLLTISEYRQPLSDITYSDIGIDENKLFERVKTIKGNADFSDSLITDLGNLKLIGGNANFRYSQVIDLGQLKSIGGNVRFSNSQVSNLGNLESIGRDAWFSNSQVRNLGNLKSIGRDVWFTNSQVRNLVNLKSIGGDADFSASQVIDLGNLKSIGRNAYFGNSQITNLGNLESIGGDAVFEISQVIDLGKLKSIGGDAWFSDSEIIELGNLESISGDAYFSDSQVMDLGKLKFVGGEIYYNHQSMKQLLEKRGLI